MRRTTFAVAGLAAGIAVAHLAASQPDRAAFDRARFESRLRSQPTYSHSPVYATWGDVTLNLHEITAFQPADAEGMTIIHPGGITVPVDYDELLAVVRRYSRTGAWRPAGSLPAD